MTPLSRSFLSRSCLLRTFAICSVLLTPQLASADGGTVQTVQQIDGLRITLMTSPATLRVGEIDVSLLVQDFSSGEIASVDRVTMAVRDAGDRQTLQALPESRSPATNPLLQGMTFAIPEAGSWLLTAKIEVASRQPVTLECPLEILPPLPRWRTWGLWIAWAPLVVVLAVIQILVFHRTASG